MGEGQSMYYVAEAVEAGRLRRLRAAPVRHQQRVMAWRAVMARGRL